MADEDQSKVPPYVGFGVFKSTLSQLSETVVPSGPLDRRVLSWLSGADFPALISALRFFDLIDDDRRANDSLHGLVESAKDQDQWKAALLSLLRDKYAPIIGGLDIEKGTGAELEQAFRDSGVAAGQMLSKSTRFLVKAMRDAGVSVSPHITKPKPRSPRGPRSKRNNSNQSLQQEGNAKPHADPNIPPRGFKRIDVPGVENGYIQYPLHLTVIDCNMFEAAVKMLRSYAEAITSKREESG